VSRIGRGGPDRPQCADAAKRSRFDRVGIMLAATASGRRRPGDAKWSGNWAGESSFISAQSFKRSTKQLP
jgi:hypothetical protein